ncbi:MAG: DUF6478 family protein [Pseudomonadota bacterium]
MHIPPHSMIGRWLHRATVLRWRRVEQGAKAQNLGTLAAQRTLALRLYRPIRRFLRIADTALAPRYPQGGPALPQGTDWTWQPLVFSTPLTDPGHVGAPSGTALSEDIGLYHDCAEAEVILRQVRDGPGFDICLEVMHFAGTYLSLVLEVPPEVCAGLRRRHVLQLDTRVTCEHPVAIDARMNLRNGPNTEQILRRLTDGSGTGTVAFDLAYTQLNEKRAEKIWIDLMIAQPAMNRITLHDLRLSRYPRAEVG